MVPGRWRALGRLARFFLPIGALALSAGCNGDDGGAPAAATSTPSSTRRADTPTATATGTATERPTDAATPTATPSASPQATATPTPTAAAPTATASATATATATAAGRCADFDPLRNVYFGDLHVHTAFSFDSYVFDIRNTPADAYRFARGEPLALPPLDAAGEGTQTLRLARPLDFAAVTDHSEFLGEVDLCTVPGAAGFDSEACAVFRAGGAGGQTVLGLLTAVESPERLEEICGDGADCASRASEVWRRTIAAAEEATDASAECAFTAFVAYEYTANTGASSQHRNVIFRNDSVPLPTSYIERPTAAGLWQELRASCLDAGSGCDVLAIPHNSNQSNGRSFLVEYPDGAGADEQRAQAAFRAAIEPLVEIYQHKGDSECANGLSGIAGAPDELCEFEKLRPPPFVDCGDGVGTGGTAGGGCVSRRDFVRGALLAGLAEEERIGVNPLRLGVIASTDTHNGTPGAVAENAFAGHRGNVDDTPEERLVSGGFRNGVIFSPGGLAAVWAEENTRESLFDALRRREVFGTSGPRIAVRFFGGWRDAEDACADPALLENAYASGVPMGGVLPAPAGSGSPTFLALALRDAGDAERPSVRLQRLQIVKGWLAGGEARQKVFDVAGDTSGAATVDEETCLVSGPGFDSLCTAWTDPEFDPAQRAFYYLRVLETPSCRWTAIQCNALPVEGRPAPCSDPSVPKTIQERAWTSPIWYAPGGEPVSP
jgi:hypothetical protein